jgi:hypothetical protein
MCENAKIREATRIAFSNWPISNAAGNVRRRESDSAKNFFYRKMNGSRFYTAKTLLGHERTDFRRDARHGILIL